VAAAANRLKGRQRKPKAVHTRELVSILGLERDHLRVKVLAAELCKSPYKITKAIARGVRRQATESGYRTQLDNLSAAAVAPTEPAPTSNGGNTCLARSMLCDYC
jgi:hypothetical protein